MPRDKVLLGASQIYADYTYNSYRKNLCWRLSKSEFKKLIDGNCTYCGSPPKNKRGRENYKYNGLDRINHSYGYSVKNCLSCCWVCNSIRGKHLTVDEMRAAMRAVLRHRQAK